MKRVHSHYDNLRVARNAPAEVIRAAYKALSQKYHPDLNPGDPHAAQNMSTINVAYEVLSDPKRRKAHDEWIRQAELEVHEPSPPLQATHSQNSVHTAKREYSFLSKLVIGLLRFLLGVLFAFGVRLASIAVVLGSIVGAAWLFGDATDQQPAARRHFSQEVYHRPALDPNGDPWPRRSTYLLGSYILNDEGRSALTIDNTRRDSDAHVKVFFLDGALDTPVREFYLTAHSSFVLERLTPGRYDVRFRDLDTGRLSRSEILYVDNSHNYSLTLYTVSQGNTSFAPIGEDQF